MFYYQTVLKRHTGRFSTIWLAATKGVKITRREILKVNIIRTCEDIMDYVMVRVLPEHPSLPKPRFSLYLTSQLYYGVVIVYHKQCGILLDEIQQAIEKLLHVQRHLRIDMPEQEKGALDMPDPLCEEDVDIFFGEMRSAFPSPSQLNFQAWSFLEMSSPVRPHRSPSPVVEAIVDLGHIALPEAITLREDVPELQVPEFEGEELVEPTDQDIEMLMRESGVLEEPPQPEAVDEAVERPEEASPQMEVEALALEVLLTPDNVIMFPSDDAPPPLATSPTARTEETSEQNGTQKVPSSLEPAPLAEGELRRKGARRRKPATDHHIQISQDAMRNALENPLQETLDMDEATLWVGFDRRVSAEDLANGPYSGMLNPDLQLLWRQHAVLRRRPKRRRGARDEDEEEEEEEEEGRHEEGRGGESVHDRSAGSHSELEIQRRRDDSSGQIARDSAESGLYTSEVSGPSDPQLVSPDVSKEGRGLDAMGQSVEVPVPLPPMEPIQEEMLMEDAMTALPPELPEEGDTTEVTTDSLYRAAHSLLLGSQQRDTSFESLLPPEANRRTAAQTFYKMLELVKQGKMKVRQPKPFDPIILTLA
ncbi:REC8 meiotic recombination protein b [Engraulis encrasicolus]|uniref:REC8 meiotic recombination protein b n=1 Tax=Engraulis encrasicolus TaxID=184585 RepID=UPI002FD6A8C8